MLIKISFFNETEADLNKFDKIIDELEPGITSSFNKKSISNKTLEWLLLMLIHCLKCGRRLNVH
jgi:hypothetical protein